MFKHTISVAELDEYLSRGGWDTAAGSWSATSNKKLEISRTGQFRVTNHGNTLYTGDDRLAAIEAYNKLP